MAKEQKVKISEIAVELGKQPKEIIAKALEINITIKSVNSSVTETEAQDIYNYIATGKIPDTQDTTKNKKTTKKAESKTENKENKEVKENKKESAKKTARDKKPKNETTTIKTTKKAESKTENKENKEVKEVKEVKENKKETIEPKDNKKEVKHIKTREIIIISKNNQDTKKEETNKEKISLANEIKDKILHPIEFDTPKKETKKKKDVKKVALSHKTNEQKIDLNRNLGDTNIDDENEVMLFDINEIDNNEIIEEKNEEKITDRVRIQRANPWFFDNIGRERKKSKKNFNKKDSSTSLNTNSVQKSNDIIKIPDEIRVYEFADKVNLRVTDIISKLFKMGEMVTKNDFLDSTMIEILAQDFNLNIEITKSDSKELEYLESVAEDTKLISRPPVVTIMGHVDHGKTSLLDYIRNSRISKSEYGGITQHIGAYMVEKNGKQITFIDTPGHEAFAAMRSRGAQVTDIAIIVIAADDGVKQQTKEALKHAKESNVQIIIAINKMDKENANPDRVKTEMAEIGYTPTDWGGDYDFIPVSAKSGAGIDELLDTILIQAELMELQSNVLSRPKAVVLEGSLDKGKGPVVTVIIQDGVLKVGDCVVADTAYGKVRALIKDNGEKINELNASEVALLTGLNEVPSAGAILIGVENEVKAKEYATKRKSYLRTKELSKSTKVSLDELSSVVANSKLKPLLLIIKTDTQGSLEAIKTSLETLSNEEVNIKIISSSVGNITENDIAIAQSNNDCYILGFNVKPLGKIKTKAKEQNVSIKSYSVIYNLIDDVKTIIANMMSPDVYEEVIGNVEVRDIFSVGKGNVIAGCFVNDGSVHRGDKIRVLRKSKEIHTGVISSLKRFKDDVKEVTKGYECGIMIDSFNDIQVGDNFEIIKEIYKQKQL